MRTLLAACILMCPTILHAQMRPGTPGDSPANYWNRGFGCSQASENSNITLRADDIGRLVARIDLLMTDAGAPSQLAAQNQSYNQGGIRSRQLNYLLPRKNSEKVTKKLLDIAELTNYSVNRSNADDTLKQVEERIDVLEKELANKEALSKLPTAEYFLRSRLTQLQANREICKKGAELSMVSINVQLPPNWKQP